VKEVKYRPLEYCCECGEPTGNAGRDEDSLYIVLDEKEIGPLCQSCYDEIDQEEDKT
jgi:hypothetical protein